AVAAATTLVEREGAEAIVVSFLWSFRNPANEQAVRAALAAWRPDVPVVLGSDLAPVIREYERTQFALLNAYVGGSLDWLGPVGAIRVGPRSAGAEPGPACYGRGGTAATVTDALVVLGYLDPARFLDGRMPLDAGRAHDACAAVGKEAGIDAVEA